MQAGSPQKSPQKPQKTQVSPADLKVQIQEAPQAEKNEKTVCSQAVPGPQRA